MLQLNVMSMAPITACQFGTNRFVTGLLGKEDSELSRVERFGCAAAAGATSALIATPSELIIIHQQVRQYCCTAMPAAESTQTADLICALLSAPASLAPCH